jgi:hypothetical protein
MSKENRLTPPLEPAAKACICLYHAAAHLADALLEDEDLADCMEYDDFRAVAYIARTFSNSLESGIAAHPAIKRAEQRYLKKAVKLEHRADELLFPREVIERIEPSTN